MPLLRRVLSVKMVLILEIRRQVWYSRHINFWNETDLASRSVLEGRGGKTSREVAPVLDCAARYCSRPGNKYKAYLESA